MSIEVCVLASGSGGNATFIRSGETAILIDSGLSCRELSVRLARVGAAPDSLDAVVLSHEHYDHLRGVGPLSRRHLVPVLANGGTAGEAKLYLGSVGGPVNRFTTGRPFAVGCLEVRPFPVPHDAAEPVGFTVSDGRFKVGVATDLGSVTREVLEGLKLCHVLVLESNHDESMLREGPYPPFLKARVGGPEGHLSNSDAGALIESVYHGGLGHVVLAHLSKVNNVPELPLQAARKALGRHDAHVRVSIGCHDDIGEVITIG